MASDEQHNESEQRVNRLLAAAREQTRAPAELRAQIGALRSPGRVRPTVAGRFGAVMSGAAMSAAAVAALAVVALTGSAAPSLAAVISLARRPPAAPAPAPDTVHPQALLSARMGALHFPNWRADGGWVASGQRSEQLSGRHVVSVYYNRGSVRLVYSIVAAPVLSGSVGSVQPYVVRRRQGSVSVIWTEAGHTCVLSGSGVSVSALWRLVQSDQRQTSRWTGR